MTVLSTYESTESLRASFSLTGWPSLSVQECKLSGQGDSWVCRLPLFICKIHWSLPLANLLLRALLATTTISLFLTLFILLWMCHQLNLPRGIGNEKMGFQVLSQISDLGSNLIRRKERVGGLVTGFTNASHTLWFNFRPFHSMETALSKVAHEIQDPYCCVPGPPQCGASQLHLNLQPRKPSGSSGRYPPFYAFVGAPPPPIAPFPNDTPRSLLLPLNTSVSFFVTWMMFYLQLQSLVYLPYFPN